MCLGKFSWGREILEKKQWDEHISSRDLRSKFAHIFSNFTLKNYLFDILWCWHSVPIWRTCQNLCTWTVLTCAHSIHTVLCMHKCMCIKLQFVHKVVMHTHCLIGESISSHVWLITSLDSLSASVSASQWRRGSVERSRTSLRAVKVSRALEQSRDFSSETHS